MKRIFAITLSRSIRSVLPGTLAITLDRRIPSALPRFFAITLSRSTLSAVRGIFAISLSSFISVAAICQVGIGTATPDASAALDVSSNSKGLLIPQMTQAQRLGIVKPATGLLIYQADAPAGFYYNAGTPTEPNWLNLTAYTLQQNVNTNGKWISHNGTDSGLFVGQEGLGIGNSTPDSRLTVQQKDENSKLASFRSPQGVGTWDLSLANDGLQFIEPANPNTLRLWLGKGKVGIGTATPWASLGIRTGFGGDLLSFHLNDQARWHLNLANGTDLDFMETGIAANRFRIKAGGQIGIGTADPYARLGIAANPNGDLISFAQSTGPTLWNLKLTGTDLHFDEGAATKRLYLKSGGKVGFGTSNIFAQLAIKGNATNDLLSFTNNQFDDTRWHISLTNGSDFNIVETGKTDGRLYFKFDGNTGINTTNPTEELDVVGDIKYSGVLYAGHTYQYRDAALEANTFRTMTIGCPAGMRATGGGGGHRDFNSAQQNIVVNYSGPDPDNPNTHWRILVDNNHLTASRDVRVYVLCAKIQ